MIRSFKDRKTEDFFGGENVRQFYETNTLKEFKPFKSFNRCASFKTFSGS